MDKTIGLIVIGIILLAIISAFIFSSSFRKDVIASEGEAAVLGVINVKGVIIVLLTGIFGAIFVTIIRSDAGSGQTRQDMTTAEALDYIRDNKNKEKYEIANEGGFIFITHDSIPYKIGKLPDAPPDNSTIDFSGKKLIAKKDTNDLNKWNLSLGGSKVGNVSFYLNQALTEHDDKDYFYFGQAYEIGNLDFWFIIDAATYTGGNNKYEYLISFGEGPDNNIIWKEKKEVYSKSDDGKIILSDQLKLIQDPQWKNNYWVGLGAGQPTVFPKDTTKLVRVELFNIFAAQSKLEL